MDRRKVPFNWRRLALVFSVGALLTACAGGGAVAADGEVASTGGGLFRVDAESEGEPVSGGVFSYATYADVTTLDPAAGNPFGTTGGTEMSSIYDLLVRYDFESKSFEPQLAESMSVSSDQTVWTMKLRPGVKFSDGSPVDAAAVKWSIDRYNDERGVGSDLWLSGVVSTDVVDDSTLTFTLSEPWPGFQSLLALGHGMVVAESSVASDVFTPVGAGAFTVDKFSPHEELLVKARADYWGGKPNLDAVRFVALKGEQARLEALRAGGVDAVFIRNPEVVGAAKDEGLGGFVETSPLGSILQINNRSGSPGADVRVRQAVAHAVDVEGINARVWGGAGQPGSEVFQESSTWHNGVEPLGFSPDRARDLLAEAKADGYDGKIRYLATQDVSYQNQAVAVQAMLQSVGFEVTIDYVPSTSDLVRKISVDRDFDLAAGGWNLMDAAPFMRLQNNLRSGASNNNAGYANPEMDVLLDELKRSGSAEETLAVIEEFQNLVNDTVPFVALGAMDSFVAWAPQVHGVNPSLDGILLLEEAWVSK